MKLNKWLLLGIAAFCSFKIGYLIAKSRVPVMVFSFNTPDCFNESDIEFCQNEIMQKLSLNNYDISDDEYANIVSEAVYKTAMIKSMAVELFGIEDNESEN